MTQNRRGAGQAPDPERMALAAVLCWDDRKTDDQIARSLGIARRTLSRWKDRPEFRTAMAAARLQWCADGQPARTRLPSVPKRAA